MKQLAYAVLAVGLVATGFGIGWAARGSYAPIVTVQMGPLERSWFMPVGAMAYSKDSCAIVSAFRAAGRDAPADFVAACAKEIDEQLTHAITTPVLIPARK